MIAYLIVGLIVGLLIGLFVGARWISLTKRA
jgi:uncharacterized protein YneF (UPF0154 family)